jgi:hypothetical protein
MNNGFHLDDNCLQIYYSLNTVEEVIKVFKNWIYEDTLVNLEARNCWKIGHKTTRLILELINKKRTAYNR